MEHRALYPWESSQGPAQPRGLERPLEDAKPAPEAAPPEPEQGGPAPARARLRLQKPPVSRESGKAGPQAAPPPPPTGLCAAPLGTKRIALQWEAGESPAYRIYRSAAPWRAYGLIAETQESRYLDTVPEPGTKYYYFVQAVRDGRAGEASVMAEATAFPPLPPPEPPARLRATPMGDAVELRWNHARGAAAYAVFSRTEGGEFRVIGHTLDNGFLHEALPPDILLEYRVQSYHDSAASELSARCGARTGAPRAPRPRMRGLSLSMPFVRL